MFSLSEHFPTTEYFLFLATHKRYWAEKQQSLTEMWTLSCKHSSFTSHMARSHPILCSPANSTLGLCRRTSDHMTGSGGCSQIVRPGRSKLRIPGSQRPGSDAAADSTCRWKNACFSKLLSCFRDPGLCAWQSKFPTGMLSLRPSRGSFPQAWWARTCCPAGSCLNG